MPQIATDAERLARQAAFLGALAAIGALVLAVLGWAGGAVATWMGVAARRRGAGRTAVVAIVLGVLGLVAGVANALLGAYLLR
ncbi:hypothetical protein [Pseudonocardia spirodelae]|uniref:DUF4190 domain-containing protein n=1 Tax=Pseudonocardia spirodelae TaxID=3133431 RepID=A0ABU8T2E8_9PSEU